MRQSIGLETDEDADFSWPWDMQSSSQFFAVSIEALKCMLAWTESFVAQARAYDLVMGTAREPRYRFCAGCVREHKVMHYSAEGRFEFMTLCPRHGTPMKCGQRKDVYGGVVSDEVTGDVAGFDLQQLAAQADPRQAARLHLERRICAAVKCGFERSSNYGIVPARSLIAAEAWRLMPYASDSLEICRR